MVFFMARKRVCADLPPSLVAKLGIVKKVENKNATELIEAALEEFIEKEISERDIDSIATDLFYEGRLSVQELELLLGKTEASAAATTKKLKGKAREFIDAVD